MYTWSDPDGVLPFDNEGGANDAWFTKNNDHILALMIINYFFSTGELTSLFATMTSGMI